jgi:hypothetical protein
MAAGIEDGREVAPSRGLHEGAAVFLLLLGGFVFVVGWLAGAILLWTSRAWTTRDKLIGTLFIPGGLLTTFWVWFGPGWWDESCAALEAGPEVCVGGPGAVEQVLLMALAVLVVVAPFASAFHLTRRARRAR